MRTNLIVPYSEKDAAKSLGAWWDPARKVWYIVNVERIDKFLRWMPAHLLVAHGTNKCKAVKTRRIKSRRGKKERVHG